MKHMISRIYNSSLKDLIQFIKVRPIFLKNKTADVKEIRKLSFELKNKFEYFKTYNLNSISASEFFSYIHSKIGTEDYHIEDYSKEELSHQRDLSIKFHWGHNHDFGDFKIEGRMGNRHIGLLINFITFFPISLDNFIDASVFDIGCWTGGTTLLLSTIAKKVYAIEEVKKYAEMTAFLANSFGLKEKVFVNPISIYDSNLEEFHDRFDIAYFPGVIYHLSDPLLALRIIFNSLKIGGFILVESAGINRTEPFCRFDGSLIYGKGSKERLSRGGWNWFVPSPSALYRLMKEAGFDEIKTEWHQKSKRVYAYGKKLANVGICKAGLSIRNIL